MIDQATPAGARTLRDLLLLRAAASPDTLAFVDAERSVTFGELAGRAEALARDLAGRGVGVGSRVAVALDAGVAFAEHFWALQLIGAAPCAFNPATAPGALTARLAQLRPHLIVTAGPEAQWLQRQQLPSTAPGAEEERVALIQSTSGTSGAPRLAVVTQRNVMAQVRATQQAGHIRDDDVLVSWVPPWHDLGLVRFIVSPVFFGTPCHIVTPAITTIPEWLSTIERVGGTVTGAPDFAFRLACRLVPAGSIGLSSLRFATNGGEPVRSSTIQAFEARFRARGAVVPGYGLAEATLGVTSHEPGAPIVVDARGNVSTGVPLPGVEVVAGASSAAPEEILVRGDIVFREYLDAPADTAAALRDGWLHTGDQGYRDDAGRLFILGRRRAMIKRAGVVVAPRELEEAAQQVSSVRLAGAVGLPAAGAELTESVVVVVEAVVADDPEADALATRVTAAIREGLGFSPDRVDVVAPRSIPRTSNGKVRHAALAAALTPPARPADPG